MLEEEEQIIRNIQALEEKKKLAKKKSEIDMGRLRLITAQGDELLEEVKQVLETIGFQVYR